MKKILSTLLVVILLFGISSPILAAEENNLSESSLLSQEQKKKLNNWVEYNEYNYKYQIKPTAEFNLTEDEYTLLNECITVANLNLENVDLTNSNITVVTPEQEINYTNRSMRAYKEGVTKVDFHWWGATFYVSRTALHNAGSGLSIAGIIIPEKVLAGVCQIAGVLYSSAPGGLAFDFNYIQAGLQAIRPGMSLPMAGIRNVRWQ